MLDNLYARALESAPERPAIVFEGRTLTYAAFDEQVRRYAAALLSLDVRHGDRVALSIGNRPELVLLYFACWRIGAAAVPLNTRFQTPEIVRSCEQSGPKVLVVDPERLPRVEGLRSRIPSLVDARVLGATGGGDVGPWDEVLAGALPPETGPLADEPDLPALILFTSGSTMLPKGVTHTHRSVFETARSRARTQGLVPDDITLVASHMCHVAGSMGLTFPPLFVGGTIVIQGDFDAGGWLDLLREHRPTRAGLLPTQVLEVVEHERAPASDFSSLVEFFTGGGLVSHDLYRHFHEVTGLDLDEGYGLTECEGACLCRRGEPVVQGSVGRPREGVDLKLVDSRGDEVAVGETGEVWLRSDSVMSGYWEDPENTEKTFSDGWLVTGDLGRRDEEDHVHFVGRTKEIIIKGGSNIAPGEVEQILDDHPDVEISGVVGVPDRRLGESIQAFVEPRAGSHPTVEVLDAFVRKQLAAYKVPDHWTFVDRLPRMSVGKIDRRALHTLAR